MTSEKNTSPATLATAKRGGCVQLGDGLLPCPFCGSPAERIDFGPGSGDNEGGSCVACTVCQHSGPIEFGYKENFISNWNRRALSAQPSPAGHVDAWAIKLARESAFAHSNEHAYLPQTRQEANRWQPHEWVVAAIQAAALGDPQPAGQITDAEIDARLNALYREMVDSGQHNGGMSGVAWDRAVFRMASKQPAQAVDLWQPIETAPKNGSSMLLGYVNSAGNWRTVRGRWFSAEKIEMEWENADDFEAGWYEESVEADDIPNVWPTTPTYWQPLPAAPSVDSQAVGQSFQAGVAEWMGQCFLPSLYSNMTERGDRLLEEVLELLQAHGYDKARIPTLVDYVFGRPVGEPAQEVGGVMVTLAGYCWVAGLDMHAAGDAELARISQADVMAKIRAKQEAKNALHFDTPLPGKAATSPPAQAVDLPYSLDADPAGIRARVADVITGTLMVGAQGHTPPPAGHWADPFWQAARADAGLQVKMREALWAAAKSLRTIAESTKETEFLGTASEIRAYANSRAICAEKAVTDSQAVGK